MKLTQMNMSRALVCLLLAGAAVPALAQDGTLVTSGTGTVQVTPDQATLSVAIETLAAQASAAGRDNAALAGRVREALEQAGAAEGSISTGGYNVRQAWRRHDDDRVPDGYVAELRLEVRVDELDQIGTMIDTALAAGANRVDGVRFSSSAIDAARREALALAVTDARAAAETMAAAAGGRLGALIELSSEGMPRPMMPQGAIRAEAVMAFDGPTQIDPGELSVTARVSGRWTFER